MVERPCGVFQRKGRCHGKGRGYNVQGMMERRKLTYDISQLRKYINWPYFYHAWQLKDSRQQEKIKLEAMKALDDIEGRYHAYALFALADANGGRYNC